MRIRMTNQANNRLIVGAATCLYVYVPNIYFDMLLEDLCSGLTKNNELFNSPVLTHVFALGLNTSTLLYTCKKYV